MKSLTNSEIEEVERFKKSHLGKVLTVVKYMATFSIGDTLIRFDEDKGAIDMVSKNLLAPKKFKVIHIDDFGVAYIRQISVSGGLGTRFEPLLYFTNGFRYRYMIDPDQIDSILLGYKYDPRAEYRKLKEKK